MINGKFLFKTYTRCDVRVGRKLSKHEGERSVSEKSIESNGMNNGSNRKNGNVRESFNSQWGFILACIGSAVGMGNIWMFPYRLGQNGGAAFLIPYFLFVALFGYVGLSGEFALGRMTGTGPVGSYDYAMKSRGLKGGKFLGAIPLIGSFGIAIGYSVIVGWVLRSIVGSLTGRISQSGAENYFAEATTDFGSVPWCDQRYRKAELGSDAGLLPSVSGDRRPGVFPSRLRQRLRIPVHSGLVRTPESGNLGHGYGTGLFLPVDYRFRNDYLRKLPE